MQCSEFAKNGRQCEYETGHHHHHGNHWCSKCGERPQYRRSMCKECNTSYSKNHRLQLHSRWIKMMSTCREDKIGCDISFLQYCALLAYSFCFYCDGPLPPQGKALDRKENGSYSYNTVLPCCGQSGFKKVGGNCNHIKGDSLSSYETFALMFNRQTGLWPSQDEFYDRMVEFQHIRDKYYDLLNDLTIEQQEGLKHATDIEEYVVSLDLGIDLIRVTQ